MKPYSIILDPTEAAKAASNVALFLDKTCEHFPDAMHVSVHDDGYVEFIVCDDYVSCIDSCSEVSQESVPDEFDFTLTADQAKQFIDFAKSIKNLKTKPGYLEIELNIDGDLVLTDLSNNENKGSLTIELSEDKQYMDWRLVRDVLFPKELDYPSPLFGIRPERLVKLARVKVPFACPIDMKFVHGPHPKRPFCLVKIGPTFRATIACIDREVAMQNEELPKGSMW